MDVWTQIVKRDGVLIGAALDRDLFAPFLREKFPGEPIMAHFELGHEEAPSASETAELATKLKTAGYLVDQSELEEQVGFKLVKDETPAPGAFPAFNKILNKAGDERPDSRPAVDEKPSALLAAFAKDTSAAGKAVAELLQDFTPEAAKALLDRLPSLLPDDPEMATVIAEAMAEEFGDQIVKNKVDQPRGKTSAESTPGSFAPADGGAASDEQPKAKEFTAASQEEVSKFLKELPDKITEEEFDSLLTTGFADSDGDGNVVKYGKLLRDHWGEQGHNPDDTNARKTKLGVIVKMIRSSKPIPSGDPSRPNEKVYLNWVGRKAYIAIADEHNEIDALVMVSYRRDGRKDLG